MDALEAFHVLKTAYPDLSRQQGRQILRGLVQQLGKAEEAALAIQRLIPDPVLAAKLIDCIRRDFAHKNIEARRQAVRRRDVSGLADERSARPAGSVNALPVAPSVTE